jgi:predicted GIY-YIG superfamily endonuclease
LFEQAAEILFAGDMPGAHFAGQAGQGFVFHFEPLQPHDADELLALFPNLTLRQFHADTIRLRLVEDHVSLRGFQISDFRFQPFLSSAGAAKMGAMPQMQSLLFPDPCPLVERLGREFFRQLPERPGVYLMRDAHDAVLYVGKAKNLRQRLCSYRVANPDRMPRRHLRLLRAVQRIELQECADESSALARESELLRALKPKFNRAGTWPSKPRFLVWRCHATRFELDVTETPPPDARQLGPLGSGAIFLRVVLVRLLWFAVHPELGIAGMPAGWARGRLENPTVIHGAISDGEVNVFVEGLFAGQTEAFCQWIRGRMKDGLHPFEKSAVEADLESLADFFPS